MSIGMGNQEHVPNWIAENDWSPERRIEWIGIIMALSSRDWSVKQKEPPGAPEPELWALYCLALSDTKEEAFELWQGFCENKGV